MSGAKGGSVINDSVEKEIGSLAWPCYSPPGLGFRTPEDWSKLSFPLKKKKQNKKENASNQALMRATLGCRWKTGWWVGSRVGGIQPVPIVATVQLHLSQHGGTIFTKPPTRSQPRQQLLLKTSLESTLKAERETLFYL